MLSLYLSLLAIVHLFHGMRVILMNFFNGTNQTPFSIRIMTLCMSIMIPSAYVLAMLFCVLGLIAALGISVMIAVSYGLFLA